LEADLGDEEPSKAVKALLGTNALASFTMPQMDLVGPTIHDDIRRAIQRYGAEVVKGAVKEATKAKRGRPREPDWPELREVIRADALEWLAGRDPFTARSNYAIAKEFAQRKPGHYQASTHKRIERKLSRGPHDRRWFTLVMAENLSRDGFPYTAHLRAIDAVASLPGMKSAETWRWMLDRARSTIADYEAREGKPPDPTMSFAEVDEAVRKGGLAALVAPPKPVGLFGLASLSPPASPNSGLGSILSDAIKDKP
jgi:hypothetical protein